MYRALFLHLAQFKLYWQLRKLLLKITFRLNNNRFKFKNFIEKERNNYYPLKSIFRDTELPVFFALAFAILIQLVDPFLTPYCQLLDLKLLGGDEYVTYLATISGIGGVFIGLYYAGITTVGGAIYAKVPNDIRSLLAQERFGNVYMRYLSFLTFLCLILIAFHLSSFQDPYLAIPFVTFAAGIGIFAFVKLGQRAFNLFDPTALSSHIFEQLHRWIGSVRVDGYQWRDDSFQLHAYKNASRALSTLDTLVDITVKEPHLNGGPFIDLTKNILIFLVQYQNIKNKIPTKSNWYEKQYEHRDWYRTQGTYITIAHQTGTAIQPEITTNSKWIEDRLLKIIKQCILINIKHSRYSETLSLLEYLDAYIKTLASSGRVDLAFAILEDLTPSVIDLIAQEENTTVELEVLEKLAVIENLAYMPISIALAYRETLIRFSKQNIDDRFNKIRWHRLSELYKSGFPAYCLPQLEWIQPRMHFERRVDGLNITPTWYLTELILQVEAEQFVTNIDCIVIHASKLYSSTIETAKTRKHPWLAAAVMSREWEYLHKLENQTELWPAYWKKINDNRLIDGLSWPTFELDSYVSTFNDRRSTLLALMSQQNMLLALYKRPDGFPDYAGQFLHTAGEVAFDALVNNDHAALNSVFKPYMFGCLIKFESLRPKAEQADWRVQQDFKIAAAALLDVMDISGYGILFADLNGNQKLWTSIKDIWDDYLTPKNGTNPLVAFAGAINLTDMAFELPHRGEFRMNWRQRVSYEMDKLPRREVIERNHFTPTTVIEHDSYLVQIFAESRFSTFDGIDVFIALYLEKLGPQQDINFGNRRHTLIDKLDRREKAKKPDSKDKN